MGSLSRLVLITQTAIAATCGGLVGHAQEAMSAPETATTAAGAKETEQAEVVELERLEIYSTAVANQNPAATFAMPVSLLRYEPRVDVQGRGTAEAQADVAIRGGTFENTGFSVGAVPLYDPQTGHYFAELPVAPAMLGAPSVRTGAEQAARGFNATAGGVDFGWKRIRDGGFVDAGAGDNGLVRGEVYVGQVATRKLAGQTVGIDVSVAGSEGDGPRTFADHNYERYNARLQFAGERTQTDFFAGYQAKEFGWPNLYAARNQTTPLREEREALQTKLFVVNHRAEFGAEGDYLQVGAYYRGNRDFYRIPVFGPGGEFRHQTLVRGAALDGRVSVASATAVLYEAGVVGDDLDSSSLTFGNFMSRTQVYAGARVEQTFELADRRELVATAGGRYDDSNREGSEASPVAKLEWRKPDGALRSVYASYDESTQLPTYQALNANPAPAALFRGDSTLGRATARNFEVGTQAVLDGWTTQAAVFYRQDRELLDYIFDPLNPASSRTATTVDVDTLGLELSARKSWRPLDLILGYTYLHKDDDYTAANVASFYALNFAEHRLTAAVIARLGGGFELRSDNELRLQAPNALRQGDDEVVLSSLGLYYDVPGVRGLRLNAQVDNLWNTAFQDVPLVPASRREWSVGATYAW